MFNKITLFFSCCLVFSSCFFKKEEAFKVSFSLDSTKIIFSGLEEVNFFQGRNRIEQGHIAENLVSVVAIDSEEGAEEKTIKGQLLIDGKTLIFEPDTPFVKGQRYLLRTILNSSFGKTTDILKSDLGHTVKTYEKVFQR